MIELCRARGWEVAIPRRGLVSLRPAAQRARVGVRTRAQTVAIPRRGLVSLRRACGGRARPRVLARLRCNPPKGIGVAATDRAEGVARVPRDASGCNPPKGIGVAATPEWLEYRLSRYLRAVLQSPEGDWCRCDFRTPTPRSLLNKSGRCNPPKGIGVAATPPGGSWFVFDRKEGLQSPEGDWCRCDTTITGLTGTILSPSSCCNPPKGIGVAATWRATSSWSPTGCILGCNPPKGIGVAATAVRTGFRVVRDGQNGCNPPKGIGVAATVQHPSQQQPPTWPVRCNPPKGIGVAAT